MGQFRAAVCLYWLSFFMYQRGTNSTMCYQLFREAMETVDPKQFDWKRREPALGQIWVKEHDDLLAHLQEKFEKYRDDWIKSPAGKHFAHMIADSQ
jgi:hypothetical protein